MSLPDRRAFIEKVVLALARAGHTPITGAGGLVATAARIYDEILVDHDRYVESLEKDVPDPW
jgi:hypothetical protein